MIPQDEYEICYWLRNLAAHKHNDVRVALEAADEIERLRVELAELREACAEKQRCIDSSVDAQRTFLAEIDSLRHDIERHIAMTSELATENEALRTELAAPPSEAMIQSGSDMASLLMNVSVAVCMNGLGGSITTEEWEALDVPNKDLAEQYGREELDSVTAIYIAMRRAATAGRAFQQEGCQTTSALLDEVHALRERVAHLESLLLLAAEDYEPHDGVSPAEASKLRDELSHLGLHRCTHIKCTDTPLCRRAAMAGGE